MRRAFTLIEMLVVMIVLAILAGAVVAIGGQVKAASARRTTIATLKTCEGLMADYLAPGNPEPAVPPTTTWPYGQPTSTGYTSIYGNPWNPAPPDGYVPTGDNTTPTAGSWAGKITPHANNSDPINWVLAMQAVPELKRKVESLTLGRDIAVDATVNGSGGPSTPYYGKNRATGEGTRTVVVDAWGTPIRYVPSQLDGSGNMVKQGYFMSAGPDGKFYTAITGAPAKNDDVFSTDPQ
jgi:prepilin-type N-terminal cleavage/methylation domain-containing protein